MTRSSEAWLKFMLARVAGLVIDSAVLGAAYFAAFLLRFDFIEPRWGWRVVAHSFVTVLAVCLASLMACGCYRMSWRRTRLTDIPWYMIASAIACLAMTALRYFTPVDAYLHLRPPYSINLIYFVIGTAGIIGWRALWTWCSRVFVREENLIERPTVHMDSSSVIRFLRGKTVMVTGAGGSIGSEIVRQVAGASPARILMVERGENALYQIEREMRRLGPETELKALMVDVNDIDRMTRIFETYHPEVVLHAAAYKHVPMVEMNPEEGWRNNAEATKNLAELSAVHGVRRFVLISTDKAVNPASVMGKTKRAAEKAIMDLNAQLDDPASKFSSAGSQLSLCAVRFGNVLGSSGSVVPLFREQIEKRLPVTVTHPGMKRYFMTVREAVGLVLQAASRSEKAIYTLDMGKPVSILDLAENMIRQAGYKPYVDIPIIFTGIRPGEKLAEELDVSEKSCYKTDMAKIYITK